MLQYIYADIKHTKGKINTTMHQNISNSESRVEVSAVFAQNWSPATLFILNLNMFQNQKSSTKLNVIFNKQCLAIKKKNPILF